MISNKELDEICKGCTVHYVGRYTDMELVFQTGSPKIDISTAIERHQNKEFTITKIKLTEENRRKLYEYIAKNPIP